MGFRLKCRPQDVGVQGLMCRASGFRVQKTVEVLAFGTFVHLIRLSAAVFRAIVNVGIQRPQGPE